MSKINNKSINIRTKFFVTFITLLFVEVLIALFVHDKFVRPYIGDVLVVAVVYCAVRVVIPKKLKYLSIYVFFFATFIELIQLIDIGIDNNPFLSILLGSTFDLVDILCYGVGAIVLLVFDLIYFRE